MIFSFRTMFSHFLMEFTQFISFSSKTSLCTLYLFQKMTYLFLKAICILSCFNFATLQRLAWPFFFLGKEDKERYQTYQLTIISLNLGHCIVRLFFYTHIYCNICFKSLKGSSRELTLYTFEYFKNTDACQD